MTRATMPTVQELQDQFIAVIRRGQGIAVDALKATTEAVGSVTPKVRSVTIPFADKVPAPEAMVTRAYDWAEALLAEQRKFAEQVLKATAPLWHGAAKAKPAAPEEDAGPQDDAGPQETAE